MSDEFENGTDQLLITQLFHHHKMTVDLSIRGIDFGKKFWWPAWDTMPGIQKDVEERGIDLNIIKNHIALHWYRDPTKISTKKIVDAILSQGV